MAIDFKPKKPKPISGMITPPEKIVPPPLVPSSRVSIMGTPMEAAGATIGGVKFTPPKKEKTLQDIYAEAKAKAKAKAAGEEEVEGEPKEEFKNAQFKLIQSTMLFHKMNDWNKKNLGFDPTHRFGIRGATNIMMGRVLRDNPFVNTFEGDRYTTAMALMRAIMPGRAEKMIEGVKGTLPSIWSSDKEADEQVAQSVAQAIGTYISRRPEEFPEIKDVKDITPFLNKKVFQMKKILKEAKDQVVKIPEAAKRDEGIVMVDSKGGIEIVPYENFSDASRDGYRAITKEEVSKLKGKI